jgi:hypothetical protein
MATSSAWMSLFTLGKMGVAGSCRLSGDGDQGITARLLTCDDQADAQMMDGPTAPAFPSYDAFAKASALGRSASMRTVITAQGSDRLDLSPAYSWPPVHTRRVSQRPARRKSTWLKRHSGA